MNTNLHTFVICAYGESSFLEECIQSVTNQTVKGKVILSTATPNSYINNLVKKYNLDYRINSSKPSISGDWNFGVEQVSTKYFTIAHQDDLYKSTYVEEMLKMFESSKKPLIFFSDYAELRGEKEVFDSTLLKIKRILLWPLKWKVAQNSIWIRRKVLSFGNPICCPAVSFCKDNLDVPIFSNKFSCDLDWYAWENISRKKGSFLFCKKILMDHRIHEESTTTELIENSVRYNEDKQMFKMFWPEWIADFLMKFYSKSEQSNSL